MSHYEALAGKEAAATAGIRFQALAGNEAVAVAMRQIDPDVVAAYPITPQTTIVELLSETEPLRDVRDQLVERGDPDGAEHPLAVGGGVLDEGRHSRSAPM